MSIYAPTIVSNVDYQAAASEFLHCHLKLDKFQPSECQAKQFDSDQTHTVKVLLFCGLPHRTVHVPVRKDVLSNSRVIPLHRSREDRQVKGGDAERSHLSS